eukprot:TRINITY_DN3225_c0_g1_i5.p1 TRINITY_DN3225_c0_g1~~TRINITY_DN3225_c0_g1_i5.p1  ORF type:complete len:310 (+),score=63.46 TRINITY_DN3225_c0_g1_i5:267-1196(+)
MMSELLLSTLSRSLPHLFSCLEVLMRKGFLGASYILVEDYFLEKGIDVVDTVRFVSTQMKKELDGLLSLVTHKREIKIVQPVLHWAQSEAFIVLQVKFAHRFDSPGCLDVKHENIKIKPWSIFLSAYCVQAHQPMLFKLNFTLYREILPEVSYWKFESVGRLFMNLTKILPDIWPNILQNPEEVPKSQIQVWWDMKKYYPNDMDKFSQLLEEEEEKRAEEKRSKRRERKKRRQERDQDIPVENGKIEEPPSPTSESTPSEPPSPPPSETQPTPIETQTHPGEAQSPPADEESSSVEAQQTTQEEPRTEL